MNSADRSSRSVPVTPNLVLTSPTAEAASSNDVPASSVLVARSVTIPRSSLAASPVAPVFLIMMSIASSTSLYESSAVFPAATIGAVTDFVRFPPSSCMPSPTDLTLSPNSCIACPASCISDARPARPLESIESSADAVASASAWRLFNSAAVAATSACRASY